MGRGVALWECRRVALCRPRCSWLAGLLGQLAAVTGELLLLLTEPFKRTRSRTARVLLRAWSTCAQPGESQARGQWEARGF